MRKKLIPLYSTIKKKEFVLFPMIIKDDFVWLTYVTIEYKCVPYDGLFSDRMLVPQRIID